MTNIEHLLNLLAERMKVRSEARRVLAAPFPAANAYDAYLIEAAASERIQYLTSFIRSLNPTL